MKTIKEVDNYCRLHNKVLKMRDIITSFSRDRIRQYFVSDIDEYGVK